MILTRLTNPNYGCMIRLVITPPPHMITNTITGQWNFVTRCYWEVSTRRPQSTKVDYMHEQCHLMEFYHFIIIILMID